MTPPVHTLNFLYIGHSTIFLSLISVLSVLVVDITRFQKWSISNARFICASLIGLIVGFGLIELITVTTGIVNLGISVAGTIIISSLSAYKLQIQDPLIKKTRAKRNG